MGGEVEIVSESGKHTGGINTLLFDRDHVYSAGSDGVLNVWDKNLQFKLEILLHKGFEVLALAANLQNHIYCSGRDGSLRYFRAPWRSNAHDILMQTVASDVTALYCLGNILYSGDDKGIVKKWYNNKICCHINVHDEVKSMAVEGNYLYTVTGANIIVTDIKPDIENDDVTMATIPGRRQLILFGPKVNDRQKFLACITRDGKGIILVSNTSLYNILWTEESAHESTINAICASDDCLYTSDSKGIVKKWIDLENGPTVGETVETGSNITALCVGPNRREIIEKEEDPENPEILLFNSIYAADTQGVIKRIQFSA